MTQGYEFADARILCFAKAPVVGQVKTRLAETLGEQVACELYEQLAAHTLDLVVSAGLCLVEIWCAPDVTGKFFERYQDHAQLKPQSGIGLGERMFNALRSSLAEPGVKRAVLIGSDIPEMSVAYLRDALTALSHHDTVVGPAEDGGYVLIGLNIADAHVFEGVPWSTPDVLEGTLARISELGRSVKVLDRLWDVDRPADVQRLAGVSWFAQSKKGF